MLMPKLLIDATPISENAKGVGRYAYHICCQLEQRLADEWEIFILHDAEYQPEFPDDLKAFFVPVTVSSDLHLGLIAVPAVIKRYDIDCLFRTRDGAGKNYRIPTITVCHDVNELIANAQNIRLGWLRRLLDYIKEYSRVQAMKVSDHVICNSQFTQMAVASHYAISGRKTSVGYCGVDPRFYTRSNQVDKSSVAKKYRISNYILTFSTGDPRENYSLLPEIISGVKKQGVKTCFIIAGVKPDVSYSNELHCELLAAGLVDGEDFLFEGFLGEEKFDDLVALYTSADFYLELSLHEGFGMQLAEAMACGTSVITPVHSALGEVADRFAIAIDLENPKEIIKQINYSYINGLHLCDHSDQISFSRRYSWDDVGQLATELLTSIELKRNGT
jgi:glycosyltransferase involved in cell wall biosynthesis